MLLIFFYIDGICSVAMEVYINTCQNRFYKITSEDTQPPSQGTAFPRHKKGEMRTKQ